MFASTTYMTNCVQKEARVLKAQRIDRKECCYHTQMTLHLPCSGPLTLPEHSLIDRSRFSNMIVCSRSCLIRSLIQSPPLCSPVSGSTSMICRRCPSYSQRQRPAPPAENAS